MSVLRWQSRVLRWLRDNPDVTIPLLTLEAGAVLLVHAYHS